MVLLTCKGILSEKGHGPESNNLKKKHLTKDIQNSEVLLNVLRGYGQGLQVPAIVESEVQYSHHGGGKDHIEQSYVPYNETDE